MRFAVFLCTLPLSAALPILTPDQAVRIPAPSGVALSPDGSRVAYVVSSPLPEINRSQYAIWLASAAGGENRKLAGGSAPAWSPDGKRIGYLTTGANSQVAAVDIISGATATLTRHPRPVMKFAWSPDNSRIAFLSTDPPPKAGAPVLTDRGDVRMYRLWLLDLASGQTRLLTPGDYSAGGYDQWFPDTFSWSPDSKSIAFSRRPHAKAGGHLGGDVVSVDLDGNQRLIASAPGMDGHPVFSPDGKQVAYLANHKLDWVVTSDLMLSPAAGGPPRNLTPEFEESVKEFEWSGGHVVFSAGDRTVNRFYSVDLDTGVLRPLTHGDSVYSQLSLSADGKRCAFVMQDSITPPDVYVSEVADFRPRRVSNINPQLEQWTLVPAEVIRWKSFDGMEIEGLLHKPAAWRRGQPVPLLVVPHGGPHAVMTNTFPGHETLYFLSRGWAVFRPNFRGSGNYGERFLRANLYGWGLGDFQDLMTGVDALIASGVADPDRMAISGASYGGYMTSWTIGQSMRFRAAIVGCAITDLPSFIRTTDVPERFESYLGIDPALYLRHSPLAFGERMKTPALIWHGDQDARVPLMQSRHLYTQLLKNRVPVDLVVYPGEAHGLRRPGFQADLLERESAWLQYYVLNKGSDPAAGFSTRPYGIP